MSQPSSAWAPGAGGAVPAYADPRSVPVQVYDSLRDALVPFEADSAAPPVAQPIKSG